MVSQLPLFRLALLRRVPFWAQALAMCALFAVAGVAIVDDYGVAGDDVYLRQIANANADYIAAGNTDELYNTVDYRYLGVAFEMPLLMVERALGMRDSRRIYLMRHLITHLFFIAGGFVSAMLAYRMLGSRWIALFAMLMFLLHPRLYAHSFFNNKDIPFAALFVIALYLVHRAFRKDTLGAFLLCGIGVGLAITQRPFALMLPPMILSMRALDFWQAGREERKQVLSSSAAFLAAALATMYITHPYYWETPLRFVEVIRFLSQHPNQTLNLFMGELYRADAVPWNYIPVWFAITAPPLTLLLGAIGSAAVCRQAISRPLAALHDREIRFGVLLIVCLVAPVVVPIALQSTIYQGWRHVYFLWTPFCLLAAVGLRATANINMGVGIWKNMARLLRPIGGGVRLHMAQRALAYGVVCVGLITTLIAMAVLHPYEYVYFNTLVDTRTPDALAKRYDMDYWHMARRQSLEYLLARYPDDDLRVYPRNRESLLILPQNDRERILLSISPYAADYYINSFSRHSRHQYVNEAPAIHSVRAYGNGIEFILDTRSDAYRDHYRAEYVDVQANGTFLTRSDFDIYIHDGAMHYLKENCGPLANSNANIRVFLHFFPVDRADLRSDLRKHGFENRDFWTADPGAFFDDKCIHIQPRLPDYPIARISTGQIAKGGALWRADIDLAAHAAAQALYEGVVAGEYGQPVARSDFDVYQRGNALAYIKENCDAGDADTRFFLHIIPADPADLPAVWREHGFENLDFHLSDHGALAGDKCMAERELPDYAIERIRTGQKATASSGNQWRVDINLAVRAAAQAVYDRIAAGDYGQPVARSDFDVYRRGNRLAYLKEPCAPTPADARFFLHIFPAVPSDLPAASREFGFANLDFQFADHGADIGGKCLVERELPDYAIERIRTGQIAKGEALWRADIDLAAHAAAQAVYDRIAAGGYGPPVAQSRFDLYLGSDSLTYLKENCAPDDVDARFFLHIIPADPADLPANRREFGYGNMDFQFADHGAYAGDICVVERELPDYAIDRIRTGQFASEEGQLWSAEFPIAR